MLWLSDNLNTWAYNGLNVGLVVQDIYHNLVKTINPQAKFEE